MIKQYCIKCDCEVNPIHFNVPKEEINPSEYDAKVCWDGIVEKVSAGYGSIHDGDQYLIAICDKCITEAKENKKIIYIRNYMGFPE